MELSDIDSSTILFPARSKEVLDWETINKLCINKDFEEFLRDVKSDFQAREFRGRYDNSREDIQQIMQNIQQYMRDKLGVVNELD